MSDPLTWACIGVHGTTWYVDALTAKFYEVAALADARLSDGDITVDVLLAPHKPPKRLPRGKIAVYVFSYRSRALKVGKAGPKTAARYTTQHYTGSAPSTLAGSLLAHGSDIGIQLTTLAEADAWLRKNSDRVNLLLPVERGGFVLTLLEAFVSCCVRPVFEGRYANEYTA
ncbi:hypothetical protein [Anaeromyxobacter sp. SG17]|uniref:hypothetical protein n=1 Tax=Anaeromyxobacter sp. SG17 TaxID=2925405 RepID=UPI001F566A0D|nr:hypothetical protein [Anaeromyxobacter sp. SG17]